LPFDEQVWSQINGLVRPDFDRAGVVSIYNFHNRTMFKIDLRHGYP